MRPLTPGLFLLAALALVRVVSAQPVKPLGKPDVEFADPFTAVSGVRELRDGRVLTVDVRDKVVQLIDFKAGTAKKIGREGSGPKEYALPMAIFPLGGDSSFVYDPLNRRSLVILPNGDPGGFLTSSNSSSSAPGGGMVIAMTPPRYVDAQGRSYEAAPGVRVTEAGPVVTDSLAITRSDLRTGKKDTVGYLKQPKEAVQTSGSANNMQVRIGSGNPFTPGDDFAVTPDGRVAIIRAAEYRVDWVYPKQQQSAPIGFSKIKLTEKHKQQWRESRRSATALMVNNNNGQVTTRSGPASAANMPDPGNWPQDLPPFLARGSVLVAPNGMIWVNRTREANDDVPKYDVIGGDGKVALKVSLEPKSRVIGFGNGTVYVVRTDADDLQYLQRYRMP